MNPKHEERMQKRWDEQERNEKKGCNQLQVFIVECIEKHQPQDTSVVAHVASTQGKAIGFCIDNPEFGGSPDFAIEWYWCIYPAVIDADGPLPIVGSEVIHLNPNGSELRRFTAP